MMLFGDFAVCSCERPAENPPRRQTLDMVDMQGERREVLGMLYLEKESGWCIYNT